MAGDQDAERVATFCPLCVSRCGAQATVSDGRLVALHPDPAHPTGQALCVKGKAAPELVYHPERLLHPLRRTTAKGSAEPGWQRISWDEALDTVAARLRALARRARSRVGRVRLHLPVDLGDVGRRRLADAAAARLRQPEPVRLHGAVRLGPLPRVAVHLRRPGAGQLHARSRARRLHPVLGLQPVGRAARRTRRPRPPRSAAAPAWSSSTRGGPAWRARRTTGCGCVRARTRRWRSRSRMCMIEHGWFDADFVRRWTNAPLLVRATPAAYCAPTSCGGGGSRRTTWPGTRPPASRSAYDPALTGRYEVGEARARACPGPARSRRPPGR